MNASNNSRQEMTNLAIEKAISLMENALLGEAQAIDLRDKILGTYGVNTDERARLYRDFYTRMIPVYGEYLDEEDFEDPESIWPFDIDEVMTTSIQEYVSVNTYEKYQELMSRTFDMYNEMENDYYPFCEVYFSGNFLDLCYFSALLVYGNNYPQYSAQ